MPFLTGKKGQYIGYKREDREEKKKKGEKKAKSQYNNEELLGEIVIIIAIKAESSTQVYICVHAAHLAPLKLMPPSFSLHFPPPISMRLLHAPKIKLLTRPWTILKILFKK